MKEFKDICHEVRSVRKFEDRPVAPEIVNEIITLAGEAPSGLNKQSWLYCIVSDHDLKNEIRTACEKVETEFYNKINQKRKEAFQKMDITIKKPFLTEAPYLIIVFGDSTAPYYVESVWLSVGWFMLAAKDKGLSTLTYTPENMECLNKLLNVDDNFIPQVILPLGYGEKKGKKVRKPLDEISKRYK